MTDTLHGNRTFIDTASDREAGAERPVSTADFAGSTEGTAGIAETTATPAGKAHDASMPLFSTDEVQGLRARWDSVQASFVDEPRRAVEDADTLVAGAMKRLAETFAEERSRLEGQWDRDGEASTEDLRLALQRYRAFFGRLLAI